MRVSPRRGIMEGKTHKQLKQVALRWVQGVGCVVFACEVSWGWIGVVDVLGIKANGDVYMLEAKASNADMRSDLKRGKLYKIENTRNVDFVYYIVADKVSVSGLPEFIGIIDQYGRVKRRAVRRDRNSDMKQRLDEMGRMARACSWRAYGHIIKGEKEQIEFSL